MDSVLSLGTDESRAVSSHAAQELLDLVKRIYPALWNMCKLLSQRQGGTAPRAELCPIKGRAEYRQCIEGLASTAIRRELGRRFRCRFGVPNPGTVAVSRLGGSDAPVAMMVGLNTLRMSIPCALSTIERSTMGVLHGETLHRVVDYSQEDDVARIRMARLLAVDPYRAAVQRTLRLDLSYQAGGLVGLRAEGVASEEYEEFVSAEAQSARLRAISTP